MNLNVLIIFNEWHINERTLMRDLHGTKKVCSCELENLEAHAIEMDSFEKSWGELLEKELKTSLLRAEEISLWWSSYEQLAQVIELFFHDGVFHWPNLQANFSCFIIDSDAIVCQGHRVVTVGNWRVDRGWILSRIPNDDITVGHEISREKSFWRSASTKRVTSRRSPCDSHAI